ncbi:hypothetical protein V8C86DRAFT_1349583 [Haematococcus lacustris]
MNLISSQPPEQRTPPLPLIALVGCPEYHKDVSDYFVSQLKPPLVSLSANEPVEQFVHRYFGPSKSAASLNAASWNSRPNSGILKTDWLAKQRGRRPAVALVLLERGELEGGPGALNRLLPTLKAVRDAVLPRGAGLVVAVVQAPGAGELPAESVQALSHQLALDPRLLCPVACQLGGPHTEASRGSRDAALRNLGILVHDQCAAYYARRSQHVADKLAARQAAAAPAPCPLELRTRAAIKLAVFAEFRQDWRLAVSEYQTAYSHLRLLMAGSLPLPLGPPPSSPHPHLDRAQSLSRNSTPHSRHPSQPNLDGAGGGTLPGNQQHEQPQGV